METRYELITPERAKLLLLKNNMNRIPSESVITDYARQMRNGLWYEYTGESIKIAEDGTLLDGQQRLLALIKADVSLSFKVDYGLDKIAFKYIDIGKKRTSGDIFTIRRVPNARNMSASIRRYVMLKAGKSIGGDTSNIGGGGFGGGSSSTFSASELLSIYDKSPQIWNNAHMMAETWYKKSGRLLKCTDFLAYYMYFRDIDNNDAFEFMSKLGDGISLSANDPVKLLRERLAYSKMNPTMGLNGYTKTGLVIKAWNYFRSKQQIKLLRFSPNLDRFPIAI
jgi:hypothetical protein